jgi:hypothetical protein
MLSRMRASASAAWNRVAVQRALKVSALVVLFAAGALLAGEVVAGGRAAQTETSTTTATETTTTPGTTVITTATVQQTTTRRVTVPRGTTASTSSSGNGTPAWVWVLLGLLALGLIALVVLLARRGGGGGEAIPADERQRRLDGAVYSWTAQGWALESQTADSAVLLRGRERMLVSVDPAGHVTTQPLSSQ